jgi:hypothetical protein
MCVLDLARQVLQRLELLKLLLDVCELRGGMATVADADKEYGDEEDGEEYGDEQVEQDLVDVDSELAASLEHGLMALHVCCVPWGYLVVRVRSCGRVEYWELRMRSGSNRVEFVLLCVGRRLCLAR